MTVFYVGCTTEALKNYLDSYINSFLSNEACMTQMRTTKHDLVWSVGEEMVTTTSHLYPQEQCVLSIIYSLVE